MAITPKTIDENPKVTDTILFELTTTDADGDVSNPYKVDRVVIYHLTRDFVSGNLHQFDQTVEDVSYDTYFDKAEVAKVFGTDTFPAWLSTDTDNAILTKPGTGEFELLWTPEFTREGDFIICWTWTPLIASDSISSYLSFSLAGDTQATTTIPTHVTDPTKYTTLLDRYMSEHLKLRLADVDLTPEVLENFNAAVAEGFTLLENLANQLPDLMDANAVNEKLLAHLANNFNLTLKSTDPTLWRRQIKRAMPLFKKKGTLSGLTEALAQAGITLTGLTRLWQVVSSSTWQDGFVVADPDELEFTLSKLAIITPSIDSLNFEVHYRPEGTTTYTELTTDYISFSNNDGVTTATWIGEDLSVDPITLEEGDVVRIIYKIAAPADQSVEDYIRTLPLADLRDEVDVTYPKKNWNVRLIAEDDEMFDVICTNRHPFTDPVIFGKIRTEFPYSENIYNMEEYNGSIRDSVDPCHIDKNFLDSCSCCMSSKFDVDLAIEQLSNVRIEEARQVIREFVPFHAQVQTMNLEGSVTDMMPPNVEDIEFLVKYTGNEDMIMGQAAHHRIASEDVKRDALASSSVEATGTGTGTNREIVLFSPDVRFDSLGIIESSNLLEILSGPDLGSYEVSNPNRLSVGITQASPDSITFPLDTAAFTFRLSNELFSGSATTVTQDDLYTFTDSSIELRHTNVQPGWKIEVTSPIGQAGTYIISDTFPDDSIKLTTWPTTTTVPNITYQLKTDLDVNVGSASTTGNVSVTRQGRINVSSAIETDFNLQEGDWVLIASTQYQIVSFTTTSEFYITGYTGGNTGVTAIVVYRRLLNNTVGYLDLKGMRLVTPSDHEAGLGITNGANGAGPTLEDNSVKENYMVLIGSNYYQITQIDGDTIDLEGPFLAWGLSGTSVAYSMVHFPKTVIEIEGQDFYLVDRRNNDVVSYSIETGTSMAVMAEAMNRYNNDQVFSPVFQSEEIRCEIEYR